MIEEYKGQLPENMLDECKKLFEEHKLTKKEQEDVLKKLKTDFDNAKINPGEAIGVVTAESFGEPGTQMSIAYDEKIIVKINNEIKIIKIGEFVDDLMSKRGKINFNDSELSNLNDLDIYAPSLDQDEKVQWKKVVECSRHDSPKYLMKIKTKYGREIIATENHSFVVRHDNKIIPIKGSALVEGDRIPVVKKLQVEMPITEINVADYLECPTQEVVVNGSVMLRKFKSKKAINPKVNLNPNSGWFIGAYLSEGHANDGEVSISNVDDKYIENTKSFVKDTGLDFRENWNSRGFALGRDLKVSSSMLAKFIKTTCGAGSKFKKVPDFAYNAPDEFVSALLRAYFDGDGNFSVSRKMIRASSNSEELVKGVSLLLARFGIIPFKTKDKKGQHWLSIPYKYAQIFLEDIGSDIGYKRKALEKLAIESEIFLKEKSQDYNDMLSGFGTLFHDAAKKVGMPTRYVNNFTKRQKIGRTALARYAKKFEELAFDKNVDLTTELKVMKRMENSDVVWDEIVKIDYIEPDRKQVYDLSVPGLETFTTFDGIVTHNTLNVFHFAGVAEVAVTLGLPRLIEILDARKEIATPLIDVFIEKPDNKDADKVKKIAASLKETKLGEISSEFAINIAKLQIEVTLNKQAMRDFGITEKALLDVLTSELKTATVKEAEGKFIVKTKAKEEELLETYKLKEKLKSLYVKGVKGITSVLPVKKDTEYMVVATGTNLKDLLQVKGVDATRTKCNSPHDIVKVFGIEAARQVIIKEITNAFEDQGLEIDIRHVMFVADLMTNTGSIKGITRSGITGEKESVLARASFETPIPHLIKAALVGEQDELNSVIENVILNQEVPVGTGLPDLVVRMKSESEMESNKKTEKKEDKK